MVTAHEPATAVDLEALKRVAEAATPGPWQVYRQHLDLDAPKQQAMAEFERLIDGQGSEDGKDFYPVLPMLTDGKMCPGVTGCGPKSEANADFIAAANPAVILSLIAELEQRRAGAPRWIAVSERMPDDEQPVWLHQDGWSVVPGYREFDVWRHREDWRISQPSGGMQPTHWAARYEQPAPSPPEAVKP